MIYNDFTTWLSLAVLVSFLVIIANKLWFKKPKENPIVECAYSFLPILLAVLLLRTFLVEPFRIPSGSMKPTLLEWDFILVNKFAYGLNLPIIGYKIKEIGGPNRGDVLVFRYPPEPQKQDLIKRVIGLPGDKIIYKDNRLYINGNILALSDLNNSYDYDINGRVFPVQSAIESLPRLDPSNPILETDFEHAVYLRNVSSVNKEEMIVPEGQYFVMGDNRNSSLDSRIWGFVPEELIIGKAFFVWMSLDTINFNIRWDRLGMIK